MYVMKIYLITHPDTVINRRLRQEKWKISRDGWKQVRNLGKKKFWKDVEFIFTSTEPKANLSAKYWSKKHNIPMKIVNGIEEIDNRKFLPKKKLSKNLDLFYAEPSKHAGDWETAEHCLKRMIKAINKTRGESRKKHYKGIAIVSHGAAANLYVCHLKKILPNASTGQKKIGSWIKINSEKQKVLSKWQSY